MIIIPSKQIGDDIGCKLMRSSTQSISPSTLTTILWDTELYDTDSMHESVTNPERITINHAGKYLLSFYARYVSVFAATMVGGITDKTGTAVSQLVFDVSFVATGDLSISAIVDADVGDYFVAQVFHNNVASQSFNANRGWFAAQKIDRAG